MRFPFAPKPPRAYAIHWMSRKHPEPAHDKRLITHIDPTQRDFTCGRCGACCRNTVVLLSLEDVGRMLEFFQNVQEFAALIPECTFSYPGHQLDTLKVDKHDCLLALQRVADNCAFVREDGSCAVYDVRPMVCRAFPFEVDATGTILMRTSYRTRIPCKGAGRRATPLWRQDACREASNAKAFHEFVQQWNARDTHPENELWAELTRAGRLAWQKRHGD